MAIDRPRESVVLRACLDFLGLAGVFAWRANNGGVFDPARRRFRSFHGMPGVADILGILPPNGRLLACETKRPGGKLSVAQEAFLNTVRQLGGLAVVVSDVGQLQAALRAEGVIG